LTSIVLIFIIISKKSKKGENMKITVTIEGSPQELKTCITGHTSAGRSRTKTSLNKSLLKNSLKKSRNGKSNGQRGRFGKFGKICHTTA